MTGLHRLTAVALDRQEACRGGKRRLDAQPLRPRVRLLDGVCLGNSRRLLRVDLSESVPTLALRQIPNTS